MEAVKHLYTLNGSLNDLVVSGLSFSKASTASADETNKFTHALVRLVSLLSCCSLNNLVEEPMSYVWDATLTLFQNIIVA